MDNLFLIEHVWIRCFGSDNCVIWYWRGVLAVCAKAGQDSVAFNGVFGTCDDGFNVGLYIFESVAPIGGAKEI